MFKTFDSADPLLGSCPTEIPTHVLNALQTKCSLWNFFFFFFNFVCAAQLAGLQFPDQGLNPGHGSESAES